MIKLIEALKSAAKRSEPIVTLHRQARFLKELTAHRKLIRPYRSPFAAIEQSRIVGTPLLIGYFETGLGLGEHARGLASALEAVGAPFAVYPYNSYTGRLRGEAPWARLYDVDHVHSINIFCMAADQTRYARRIIGKQHTENSYNILYTSWELPRTPEAWRTDLGFFNELWAPTRFAADSFRPIFSKTLFVLPLCIDLDTDITANRAKFGLDAAKFYFLFYFDFSSFPERKNPLAVIKAFEAAFPNGQDNTGLILKTTGARHLFPKMHSALESAASRDRRIMLFHGDWPRADVLALSASADCFVSLHRSEGFGLGMAESMALGKPVIATDFSGNTEFLTAETGYPVPCQMRPVGDGEYPHHAGNSWAEPDARTAAVFMRAVAGKSDETHNKALRGQAYVRQRFSPEVVGRSAAARLREITASIQRASHG